jgi:hypothetical protein
VLNNFPHTYIRTLTRTVGVLDAPPTPRHPPPPVRGSACVGERGKGGGIRCINMNGRTSNGTTIIMATYTSTSGSAAATVSAGCAGDDHKREKDRFVYCTLSL